MSRNKATATVIAKIKKQAKALSRSSTISHSEALEKASIDAGFKSWHEANESSKYTSGSDFLKDVSHFAINPQLPEHFFQQKNELRSAKELDEWWDRPFAQVSEDGVFVVRCLDGGAWDRPTYYGTATSLEDAYALAKDKLAKWQRTRRKPHVMVENGFTSFSVIRSAQHPHGEIEVLKTFTDQNEVAEYLKKLEEGENAA